LPLAFISGYEAFNALYFYQTTIRAEAPILGRE
jgi:hypothetical protein